MEKQKLVLVAEDDPVVGMAVTKLLSSLGIIAHLVHNGQEAVLMANKIPYCLILMDIQMPKVDGIQATREIRNQEIKSKRRVPIVALTATTDQQACIEAGMDAFLSKPITKDQLQPLLDRYVGPCQASRMS